MNYKKIYDNIINKRLLNPPTGYYEKHHIIPRSFSGNDDKDNIIALTAREHFLCHYLLIKINKEGYYHYKAIHAFMMMQCNGKSHSYNRITSRVFEKYKEEYSLLMRKIQSGKGNSQYGTRWITDGICNKKIKNIAKIPDGWYLGRKINWENRALSRKGSTQSIESNLKRSNTMKGKVQLKESKVKQKNTIKNKNDLKWKPFIEIILNSSIDFSKLGWVKKVAELLNIHQQQVNSWMKKYLPEFYNNVCFKRRVSGGMVYTADSKSAGETHEDSISS